MDDRLRKFTNGAKASYYGPAETVSKRGEPTSWRSFGAVMQKAATLGAAVAVAVTVYGAVQLGTQLGGKAKAGSPEQVAASLAERGAQACFTVERELWVKMDLGEKVSFSDGGERALVRARDCEDVRQENVRRIVENIHAEDRYLRLKAGADVRGLVGLPEMAYAPLVRVTTDLAEAKRWAAAEDARIAREADQREQLTQAPGPRI